MPALGGHALGGHRQIVDPQRLRVRQQAGAEVRREQKLVEPHFREVGRAEHDIRPVDHQAAVEPAADDAVGPCPIGVRVEAVELEESLDGVPFGVGEEFLFAVVKTSSPRRASTPPRPRRRPCRAASARQPHRVRRAL